MVWGEGWHYLRVGKVDLLIVSYWNIASSSLRGASKEDPGEGRGGEGEGEGDAVIPEHEW